MTAAPVSDLPAPDSPTTPSTSPGAIANETSWTRGQRAAARRELDPQAGRPRSSGGVADVRHRVRRSPRAAWHCASGVRPGAVAAHLAGVPPVQPRDRQLEPAMVDHATIDVPRLERVARTWR